MPTTTINPFTTPPSSLTSLHQTPKSILITGGSSGIGLATAELFLSLNPSNKITILDLSPPPSTSPLTSTLNTQRVLYCKCNVVKWAEQRAGFEEAMGKFGGLDVVFVNAGIAEFGDQFFREEVDGKGLLREPDRRVYEVDLLAAGDTVRLGIHYLRRNKKDEGGGGFRGSIVMTASLAGYLGSAGAPVYSAAKHGIVGLMRALKNDTKTLGIATSLVAPAITLTPIISSTEHRQGVDPAEWAERMTKIGVPISKPESVALAVGYLVERGMEANGQGLLVQKDRVVDFERGLAGSREAWMGREMLDLFRGGREAPLFENKL